MNIALLFNSDHEKYDGFYGIPIQRTVLQSGVVQKSGRHMKLSVGDVLIYGNSRNWDDYDDLSERVYFRHKWALLHEKRLRSTFRKATVFALVFENMTRKIAEELHRVLTPDDSYLGLQSAEFEYGPHLALFRNCMILKYRLHGDTCRKFYSFGEEDELDEHELSELRSLGFTDVGWEDKGAPKTIFDDFDTFDHFRQVATFRNTIAPFLPEREDGASELVMNLEDLNPQLFNALGSAIEALANAQHEEHIAQAALSGRRYLEKLAAVLFPPQKEPYKGKDVGPQQYRNRIWAFIGDNVGKDDRRRDELGREVDRVAEEFNVGLHADSEKDRMLRALADVANLTVALLALNPSASRNPYYAYQNRIFEFFENVVANRS